MTISSTQSAAQRAELDQALIDAAERDDALTAQALLAQGADPNAMCAALPGDEWAATAPRINALMAAAGAGAHAVAELLLRSSANPNAATPKGMTALMRATGAREWEIAALLLAAGADLAAQDCLGFTAFDLIGDEADKGRLLASAEAPPPRPRAARRLPGRPQRRDPPAGGGPEREPNGRAAALSPAPHGPALRRRGLCGLAPGQGGGQGSSSRPRPDGGGRAPRGGS